MRRPGRHLKRADFTLEPLAKWGKYPIAWRIQRAVAEYRPHLKAALDNQELRS